MKFMLRLSIFAILMILALSLAGADTMPKSEKALPQSWTDSFNLDNCTFSDIGRNAYFILEPGYQLTLMGMEGNDSVTLIITVLDETAEVDGVQTRVVEERESANNELIEVSRNFLAFCKNTSSIFYFGEDVDIYDNGKIVSHEGSWRAGENGSRPGLMMAGLALIGSSYYQEIAPDVAMDRARIVNTDSNFQTPAGNFEHCLVTEETSALEPGAREYKIYAPGVGLLKDGRLLLTEFGQEKNKNR